MIFFTLKYGYTYSEFVIYTHIHTVTHTGAVGKNFSEAPEE